MGWVERNVKRAKHVVCDPMDSGPGLALGRKVFGNNAGLKQNVYGGLELWNARRTGPFKEIVDTDPTVRAIDEIGYAKAPWRFPDDLIERLGQRFEAAIAQDAANEQRTNQGDLISVALTDPLQAIPEIRMLLDERLQAVVHSYFGSHVRIYKPDYWRIFNVDESDLAAYERFSERWHNDSGKVSILSILILMSDVSEEYGATWCVTRDTTREIFRRKFDYREHDGAVSRLVENEENSARFTGQRGEAWFINTRRTLHRAGIPQPGLHRDILGLKFTPVAGDRDVWDEVAVPEEKTLRWQRF